MSPFYAPPERSKAEVFAVRLEALGTFVPELLLPQIPPALHVVEGVLVREVVPGAAPREAFVADREAEGVRRSPTT